MESTALRHVLAERHQVRHGQDLRTDSLFEVFARHERAATEEHLTAVHGVVDDQLGLGDGRRSHRERSRGLDNVRAHEFIVTVAQVGQRSSGGVCSAEEYVRWGNENGVAGVVVPKLADGVFCGAGGVRGVAEKRIEERVM